MQALLVQQHHHPPLLRAAPLWFLLVVSPSLLLSPRIIPLLCILLMMLPLHFLVVPLIKMLGLSSLGSLLPPLEPPARPSASCEHPLRKQQPGALLSTWQSRKQTFPPLVLLSALLETMFKTQTLIESIQWEWLPWLKILCKYHI